VTDIPPADDTNPAPPPLADVVSHLSLVPDDGEMEYQHPRISVDIDRTHINIVDSVYYAIDNYNSHETRVFRRGTSLCRIGHDSETNAAHIVTFAQKAFKAELTDMATWLGPHGQRIGRADPPDTVVTYVLEHASELYNVPVIERIVAAPVFAADGSLILNPGYNASARVWYDDGGTPLSIPPVSTSPSIVEIAAARDLLLQHVLGDFPFVNRRSLAHSIALMLQPFARNFIDGCTPLYLIDAPAVGTGKGLLAAVAQILSLGHLPPVQSAPEDNAEMRKLITSVLRGGRDVLLLDNIGHKLDSQALAAALTATTWEDRLLGHNTIVLLPIKLTWIGTGNNVPLSLETARRSAPIRIDSNVEHPWLRDNFLHRDLTGWVAANRGVLVWAALTLIQHWIAQGRPEWTGKPLGSYVSWSRVMGGIVQHAVGVAGFLEGMEEFYATAADDETAVQATFLERWAVRHGNAVVSRTDALVLALEVGLIPATGDGPKLLGHQMTKLVDKVIGNYQMRRAGEKNRMYQLWGKP
jgi:putative DNA primase/helicase